MESYIKEFIPHDPTLGLFVDPDIPPKKVQNALKDYAKKVHRRDVVALYDATLLGSGKDGALFLADRIVFQNNDLQPSYEVKYDDLVEIELKKKMMGGRTIELMVNRGRATINLELDFSGKAKAAPYVERFLQEAMHRVTEIEIMAKRPNRNRANSGTDAGAVEDALFDLVNKGLLSQDDYRKMIQAIQ